jgi:hypothetical protein
MIIIRAVFSLAVLALAGVLLVVLSGHLWGRYKEETAALGFSGVYERVASQVGLAGPATAFLAFVRTELEPSLRYVQEVEAKPASSPIVREAAIEE